MDLVGCTSNEQPPADGAEALSPAPPAFVVTSTELVAPNGKRFVRVTDDLVKRLRSDPLLANDYSDQQPEIRVALEHLRQIGARSVDEMSDAELAESIRPLLHVDQGTFLAADADVVAVKAMRALEGKSVKLAESYSPSGSYDIFFGKNHGQPTHGCCGTDDRWAAAANTNWPYATVIATMNPCNLFVTSWGNGIGCANGSNVASRECTWQLIGHSTAIAAAHCFFDTETNRYWPCNTSEYGLFCRVRWGAAPDAADNATYPIPSGYPTQWGGYAMSIPIGWITATNNYNAIQYDYAVIDFSVGPIPNPGYTAGWVGWGTLNGADTLSSPYQIWGVPKTDFYDTPYATWPRIRGSTAARYPSTVSTYVTSTPGDVSAGNSGTGLIQYVDAWGGWYVTGTVRDYQNNSCCARARRLESSYLAYIQSSSTEY